MGLREEFIKAVIEHEDTEQPMPNVVYLDGDLEEVIFEILGANYAYSDGTFIVHRGEEEEHFVSDDVPNRFNDNSPDETIITLY